MREADFIYEAGLLKNTPRSGWLTIGIKDCESVAEHSFRAAVIGLVLAEKEKADSAKVVKLCLLHDFHEARMGDIHALSGKYLEKGKAGRKTAADALGKMPSALALWNEFEAQKTKEAIIAKDADALEMLFQAREYVDEGKPLAKDWIKSALERLKTKSAKQIARHALKRGSRDWMLEEYWKAANKKSLK